MKKILCLDFDGVIHRYDSGWKGATIIPDPPVDGVFQFIYEALEHFDVCIFSSRSSSPEGIEAMKEWMKKWEDETWNQSGGSSQQWTHQNPCSYLCNRVTWSVTKPSAFVTIDDRAITFTGTWPDMESLKLFKPWNK